MQNGEAVTSQWSLPERFCIQSGYEFVIRLATEFARNDSQTACNTGCNVWSGRQHRSDACKPQPETERNPIFARGQTPSVATERYCQLILLRWPCGRKCLAIFSAGRINQSPLLIVPTFFFIKGLSVQFSVLGDFLSHSLTLFRISIIHANGSLACTRARKTLEWFCSRARVYDREWTQIYLHKE